VKLPICDTEGDWNNAGRARALLVPEHCGLIKTLQPYQAEDPYADSWHGPYVHPLRLLRDLSNDDKHRDTAPVLLMPTQFQFRRVDVAQRPSDWFPDQTENDWEVLNPGQEMTVGLEVLRMRLVGDVEPEIHDAARAFPQVALPEGRVAVLTMQRLFRRVHLLLSEFARQFPAA
jgi:hypothetical protein